MATALFARRANRGNSGLLCRKCLADLPDRSLRFFPSQGISRLLPEYFVSPLSGIRRTQFLVRLPRPGRRHHRLTEWHGPDRVRALTTLTLAAGFASAIFAASHRGAGWAAELARRLPGPRGDPEATMVSDPLRTCPLCLAQRRLQRPAHRGDRHRPHCRRRPGHPGRRVPSPVPDPGRHRRGQRRPGPGVGAPHSPQRPCLRHRPFPPTKLARGRSCGGPVLQRLPGSRLPGHFSGRADTRPDRG